MSDTKSANSASNIFEKSISNHKLFYFKYLLKHTDKRLQILEELNPLLAAYQNYQGRNSVMGNNKYHELDITIETFIKKYWGLELLHRYNKEIPYEKSKLKNNPLKDEGFWNELGNSFVAFIEEQQKKTKVEINHKINFLNLLRNCLINEGLHSFINLRDARIYKRYNLLVCYKEDKKEYIISRPLLSHHELESDYLIPYYKSKPIFIDGKILKASAITRINITSTLLWHDDEIELFGHAKGFKWNKSQKEKTSFSKNCFDETNTYLKNPNAEQPKAKFKNNSITYIEQSRIDELAGIKTEKYNTSRLVLLCNELNQSSTSGSVIAVAALERAIINHVPPVFGFENFGQVVAQYKTGKSIKKNFERLLNSMKNIADNHLHSPIGKTDSLPNMTQVDFSNDLDVLLSEVCKILQS